ncbi:uncharacterized protein LOC135333572 isoform X2 [Halichondria panicea]|uniref:uncharacterized protein LOC135333572 isoform X2 n=1 Tax=Halichondria panicea TaxID=6063 RepID=UPI00312BA756
MALISNFLCVEMRVCSSSDSPYTCVTSHCRSNNVSLPSMLLHEAPTSELHEPTTTNSSIMAMTVNDSMSTAMIDNHRSYQCERIVIGFSISLGSFVFLVLAATLFALCFHHKRKPRSTTKQCNSKEDRIYASVLSIPGLLHHYPSPTLVNTQECPAYEVQKLN